MGHYEREEIDYNPVTDKYNYGDLKYVVDEKDKEKSFEKSNINNQVETISNYINRIKNSTDFEMINKAKEAIANAKYLNSEKKLFWNRQLNNHIYSLESREAINHDRVVKESRKNSEYRMEQEKAFIVAKKRYKSLSLFKKIKYFKKRPNNINYIDQSVEDLQHLYRGR